MDVAHAFGGDLGQALVLRSRQGFEEQDLPVGREELARQGLGEITVLLLDQLAVMEFRRLAAKGEGIGVAAAVLYLRRQVEEIGRLADQVERQVGQAEIDLQAGGMGRTTR